MNIDAISLLGESDRQAYADKVALEAASPVSDYEWHFVRHGTDRLAQPSSDIAILMRKLHGEYRVGYDAGFAAAAKQSRRTERKPSPLRGIARPRKMAPVVVPIAAPRISPDHPSVTSGLTFERRPFDPEIVRARAGKGL